MSDGSFDICKNLWISEIRRNVCLQLIAKLVYERLLTDLHDGLPVDTYNQLSRDIQLARDIFVALVDEARWLCQQIFLINTISKNK